VKVLGLISGTSSDGVDAALVDIRKGGIRLIDFDIYPYPLKLQRRLIDLASGSSKSVSEVCHLNFYLGERFADAVISLAKKANIPLSEIDLIGSHGQTVHHLPIPQREDQWSIRATLQIGEPAVIAERTGITTIADFRPSDMAAGGEGAPLTPLLHYRLFAHRHRSRAVVNIGGISNITYLKANGEMNEVRAFDAGPGNMLIDGLVQDLTGKRFDRNGKIARSGCVNPALLSDLMQHPFVHRKPPKSTGREVFGQAMIETIRNRRGPRSDADRIATVTAFTAEAIAYNIKQFVLKEGPLDEVITGGGGVRNPVLIQWLSEKLAPIPVHPFEALGFDSRAIEAITFALLAYNTWHHQPGNIPSVTGAVRPVVLGKIVLAANGRKRTDRSR
jgi:anhydro-N-acetylmuramic acid kinase